MRLESKFWASFGEEAIDSRQMKTALRIDRHEVSDMPSRGTSVESREPKNLRSPPDAPDQQQ